MRLQSGYTKAPSGHNAASNRALASIYPIPIIIFRDGDIPKSYFTPKIRWLYWWPCRRQLQKGEGYRYGVLIKATRYRIEYRAYP